MAGSQTGLEAQLGMKAESTYGTAVTPDRFYEFESFDPKPEIVTITSLALGQGHFRKTARHRAFVGSASFSGTIPIRTAKAGLILSHCLGGYANANVAGAENKGTITFDANGLVALGLTIQVGIPDVAGTVQPFTLAGCKIASWELSCALDGELMLSFSGVAKSIVTATALASASYTSGMLMYTHDMLGITLAGSAISVKNISIKGENPLGTRRFAGNAWKEPLVNGHRRIKGSLAFEFEALTRYGQLIAGTEVANLILTWTSPTTIAGGSGAGPYKLVATMPLVVFEGNSPSVSGPDIVEEPLDFEALYNGTDSALKLEYHSTDSAA